MSNCVRPPLKIISLCFTYNRYPCLTGMGLQARGTIMFNNKKYILPQPCRRWGRMLNPVITWRLKSRVIKIVVCEKKMNPSSIFAISLSDWECVLNVEGVCSAWKAWEWGTSHGADQHESKHGDRQQQLQRILLAHDSLYYLLNC